MRANYLLYNSWWDWRSSQAHNALFFYLQNNISQNQVARIFGISPNAVQCAIRWWKGENGVRKICRSLA